MKRIIAILLVLAMTMSFGGCQESKPEDNQQSAQTETTDKEEKETQKENLQFMPYKENVDGFAAGEMYRYQGQPQVPDYQVEQGLANIANLNQYKYGTDVQGDYYFAVDIPKNAYPYLEKNGFVVLDESWHNEYYGRYEQNRYAYVPSFITTDSALHTFHLMYDHVLRDVERSTLMESLEQLTHNMIEESYRQYDMMKGTDFEYAARRNAAYFTVAAKLLDDDFQVKEGIRTIVDEELALIQNHAGPAPSRIINFGQTFADESEMYHCDYSQFIPRGHYTQSEELKKYFLTSMWYGQMTLRVERKEEVRSAILMTAALSTGDNMEHWNEIFQTINFFVGECDDLTPKDYANVMLEVYGEEITREDFLQEESFHEVWEKLKELPAPKVNSIPIFEEDITPDRDKAITGMRFLGQRFTIDAEIFQRLMDRTTKDRMLPNGLDIPAAFGSEEALKILQEDFGVNQYPDYAGNMEKTREYLGGLEEPVWTSNLYWSWMNTLRPLAGEERPEGYPLFMKNSAWLRKELNTFLGSWTELKHDTLLYSKQPMAEMGGGGGEPPIPPDDRGYVEPNPEVFGRLSQLVEQTQAGLKAFDLLTDDAENILSSFQELTGKLQKISIKELENQPLTQEEYDIIRTYGAELEHIWDVSKQDELEAAGNPGKMSYQYMHPDAVVADVATDPNGQCLEEATGYAKNIIVAFPRDGKVVLGLGVVYSQYEFVVPLDQRMDDNTWHEKLNQGDIPPTASWKETYTVVNAE